MFTRLSPEEYEDMRRLVDEVGIKPAILQARMAELLKLRQLRRELMTHRAVRWHPIIQRLLDQLRGVASSDWETIAAAAPLDTEPQS